MPEEVDIKPTYPGEVASLDSATGKVYVFADPSPDIIRIFGGTPDEVQGHRCVSFVLDSDKIVDDCLGLTRLVMIASQVLEEGED